MSVPVPTYADIIVRLVDEINLLVNNYIYDGYNALSNYMRVPLGIISAIYIAIIGISIMMGWMKMTIGEATKVVLKIALIYTAVLNWGFVSEFFVGFINSAIQELGNALVGSSSIHFPGGGDLNNAMQVTLIAFTKMGSTLFNTGSISNVGGYVDGMIVWVFGWVMVAFAFFEIVFSKLMLAILFIFIPLMAVFLYFKPTSKIFDHWLSSVIGFALLQLFVTAALAFGLTIAYWYVGALALKSAFQIGNYGTLPIIFIGVLCIGVTWKAASLGQSLAGNISTAGSSAMLGGMIGGVIGSSMSTLRSAKTLGGVGKKLAGGVARPFKNSDLGSAFNNVKSALRSGDDKE